MSTSAISQHLPSEEEIKLAKESSLKLSSVFQEGGANRQITIQTDKGEVSTVHLPNSALRLLMEVLSEISQGNAVSVIPIHAELTTQEAADILNVSRPFLVQLLENGEVPFHKVGTHRRVRYHDLIAYKNQLDAKRRLTLLELTAQAQELNMGY